MLQQLAVLSSPVLNFPYIRRTRRNHGLEHATIHVLSGSRYRLSGRSDDSGFVLLGEVPMEVVETAAQEALRRMRNGEHHLAVHPNCGTNLLTTGFLASMVGLLGMAGSSRRDTFNRLPMVMLAMMVAILYSQPLGMALQKYFTTEGNPGDLEIIGVTRSKLTIPFSGTVTVHRVATRFG
jgi:Domain of unknown function (DUF6391)